MHKITLNTTRTKNKINFGKDMKKSKSSYITDRFPDLEYTLVI